MTDHFPASEAKYFPSNLVEAEGNRVEGDNKVQLEMQNDRSQSGSAFASTKEHAALCSCNNKFRHAKLGLVFVDRALYCTAKCCGLARDAGASVSM